MLKYKLIKSSVVEHLKLVEIFSFLLNALNNHSKLKFAKNDKSNKLLCFNLCSTDKHCPESIFYYNLFQQLLKNIVS